ncbi:3-deoxy-7-phosphoheptulonate synthase [Actinopolyspora mortivallis]|uniref:3-deoxy-7-phosphoheptulonate synthase n=1 Tax=Actinopolyspora mortivallis TaxID=33906 RepID=UPI00316ABF54
MSGSSDFGWLSSLPAWQQPDWEDSVLVEQVRDEISTLPPLVRAEETNQFRELLAAVARGESTVVQAGDCAEDFSETRPVCIARKAELIDTIAKTLAIRSGTSVVRVGRIAGQFAKPRSRPVEQVGDMELTAYRGHMVNSPEKHPGQRRPDPKRVLSGYWAASAAMDAVHQHNADRLDPGQRIWTSHEALLLDYELPMLRRTAEGKLLLTSTHWPWVGDRTRQLDGAHIALLAEVRNPVACKVGPSVSEDELIRLCARLDPEREPGKLTLIARMGAADVVERLARLVSAVRTAGHPVIWLCDPMHGNTVNTSCGRKARVLNDLVDELHGFLKVVTVEGGVAGGLHLETTPAEVTECVATHADMFEAHSVHTSLCDPRLNPRQAVWLTSCWDASPVAPDRSNDQISLWSF